MFGCYEACSFINALQRFVGYFWLFGLAAALCRTRCYVSILHRASVWRRPSDEGGDGDDNDELVLVVMWDGSQIL